MSISSQTSATNQKLKALQVFGDSVLDDDEINSLNYSSSPSISSSLILTKLIGSTTAANVAVREGSLSRGHNDSNGAETNVSSSSSNKENDSDNVLPNIPASIDVRNNMRNQLRSTFVKSRSSSRRELVKKTQDAINVATASVNRSVNPTIAAAHKSKQSSYKTIQKQTQKLGDNWKSDINLAKEAVERLQETRLHVLQLERQVASHTSRHRAQQYLTEKSMTLKKIEEETNFKSQVFREHKKTIREQADRRKRMNVEARARQRANKREGESKLRLQSIAEDRALMEERYESSKALHKTSKEVRDRRRSSFIFRSGDALRIRDLYKKLEYERAAANHASFELSRAAARDAREYSEQLARDRRESLAGRNKAAFEASEKLRQYEADRLAKEQASFDLKRAANRDVDAYKKEEAVAMRKDAELDTIIFRNQKRTLAQLESQQRADEHQSYELKWAADSDAIEYQNQLKKDRRLSAQFRNKEGVRHAKVMQELRSISLEREAESYALKWSGEKDAEKYLQEMNEARRKSLQLRGDMAKHHREVEQSMAHQELEEMHKDENLRAADTKAMEEYKRQCKDDFRQHLKLRGEQISHNRQVGEEQRQAELNQFSAEVEARNLGRLDAEQYHKDCSARDRLSLQFRRKEAHKQRLEEYDEQVKKFAIDRANNDLEREAHKDVENYIIDCKSRRRMSLVMRAKERRRHAKWEKQNSERDLCEQSEIVRDRMVDRIHTERAQHEERAKQAMMKLKHVSRSSKNLQKAFD